MKFHEILLIWIPLLITSCSIGPINEQQPQKEGTEISYQINDQKDVINSHGIMVKNREKLDEFINDNKGTQRIVHYTTEGDPIYNDLTYKDNKVQMRYDTSKDKFGSPQVINYTCGKLERNETDKFLKYTLTDCDGGRKEIEVLHIPFDVEKQDKFEFVFKYGVNLKNEINTIDKKWVKELQGAELVEISDFKLTKEERQFIYKQMVLSNYLGEKQLSNRCNKELFVSYDLNVKINSGNRHYQWSECDQSDNGIQMTQLANQIITRIDTNASIPKAAGKKE
jgi:hypothetical protein